jgi:lipase chaperone LimK
MNKTEEKALQKATNMLSKSHTERLTDKFFERFDRWERVFELRCRGMTFEAISKVLNINRTTAHKDYMLYVELKKRVMQGTLEDDQLNEITEYLERLNKQREDLQYEIAQMDMSRGGGPTAEEQMAKNTTRKVLLDVEKQIANIKKGLGLWHQVDDDYFQRKRAISQQESLEDKKNRVLELLERASG